MREPPHAEPPLAVLATSNGTGMGHLTRQLAVAMAIGHKLEPVIFSMSAALPAIRSYDLRVEYCPSRERGWMPTTLWQRYLRDRVSALLSETGASLFAFDGVAPYPGIAMARHARPDVPFVWFRRGLWRAGTNAKALRMASLFDLIIEPGDLAQGMDAGATADRTDAVRVPPISLIPYAPQLSRQTAANELGLDPDRPTALVTLGSPVAGGPSYAASVIAAMLDNPAWQVAVTHSHIARTAVSSADRDRVIVLRKLYPLVRYLGAFDAAVSAAGYNSFHELLLSKVPTLFVPSARGTDDQSARATWAVQHDVALAVDHNELDSIANQVRRLLDPAVRIDLSAMCERLATPSGAAEAASHLASLASSFSGCAAGPAGRFLAASLAVREVAQRMVGPTGDALARRILGKQQQLTLGRKRSAHLAGSRDRSDNSRLLRIDESLEDLDGSAIVEHLLPGASPEYRLARARIARAYYDIQT